MAPAARLGPPKVEGSSTCYPPGKLVLELPHARLWEIDRDRNKVICLYNNSNTDAQNGREVPILGSFPGEVRRAAAAANAAVPPPLSPLPSPPPP